MSLLLEECESFNKGEPITFFEITTAAAFLAFSRSKSDIVLMETGLGGKFDATNMVEKKVCSVITPVSMDHMNFLGTTITKITREKIGILKNSENVIVSKQKTSVRRIIRSEIKKKKIKLFEEGINWKILEKNSKQKKFSLKFGEDQYEFSYPSLFGEHQIDNASTAIATVLSLKNKKIKTNIINNGLLKGELACQNAKTRQGKTFKIYSKQF